MKKALTVGVVVTFIVIGGILFYRSTEPNGDSGGDLVPEEPMEFKEEGSVSNGGQFLQMEPSLAPPSEVLNNDDLSQPSDSTNIDTVTEEKVAKLISDVTVSMTDTGFVPSFVTVEAGTNVIFMNDGQALHWPASNVHPTHEILSGFDAKQGLHTGESYSFVFEKKGEWGFHDHLFPKLKGEIVVE